MDFSEAYLLTELGHPELAGWWGKVLGGGAKTFYDISPKQTGTGDPSPDNIRPILPGLTLTMDNGSTLTVYGGMLDVQTGTLTVQMVYVNLTSSMIWNKSSSGYNAFYALTISPKRRRGGRIICNIGRSKYSGYQSEPWVLSGDQSLGMSTDRSVIGGTTVDAWKNYLDTHDVHMAYELDEPQEVQLTQAEVKRAVRELRR